MTGQDSIVLDGKMLGATFDRGSDHTAAQMLNAFSTNTALVLARIDVEQ